MSLCLPTPHTLPTHLRDPGWAFISLGVCLALGLWSSQSLSHTEKWLGLEQEEEASLMKEP